MFRPVIPERPCPQCSGTGKVTCGDCRCVRGCKPSCLSAPAPSCLRPSALCLQIPSPCSLALPLECRGKGRLNYRGAAMLPQGAWPQW